MSISALIEVIPDKQLEQLKSSPEMLEALDQLACTPSLYGFYKLKEGDQHYDPDYDEYAEITEPFSKDVITKLTDILQTAESNLPEGNLGSFFESAYQLHADALPKALKAQGVKNNDQVADLLLHAKTPLHDNHSEIFVLPHQKTVYLSEVLKSVEPNKFLPFYKWQDHAPLEVWQEEVQNQMVWLFDSIHYAANNDASLLYIYC